MSPLGADRLRQPSRGEPKATVVLPDLPIIDAHHHLFHRPQHRYLLDDYLVDLASGHNVAASVYVETQAFIRKDGPESLRALGEIEFANGAAAASASGLYGQARVAAAIIGHADLRLGGAIAPLLDKAMQTCGDRFRGVRQVALDHHDDATFRFMQARPPVGILSHPGIREGLATLAARKLVFETAVFHHQLPRIAALADAVPEATIVLNHAGMALALDRDEGERRAVFAEWKRLLLEIGQRPNVLCKIGGLAMPYWGFQLPARSDPAGYVTLAAIWRPYVEVAVEAFGAGRCMLESNFPIDGREVSFVNLWNAYKLIVSDAFPGSGHQLLRDTAARTYRIDQRELPLLAVGSSRAPVEVPPD